jgi:Tfp pilus assembly protein PilX
MFDFQLKERGVALLVVLATLFVVVILANIALNTMISQSRLTHHKVNRIQAEYVAWAAVNYAQERLRTGAWSSASCPAATPCPIADASFPSSVASVDVILRASGIGGCAAPSGSTCVSAEVTYIDPAP